MKYLTILVLSVSFLLVGCGKDAPVDVLNCRNEQAQITTIQQKLDDKISVVEGMKKELEEKDKKITWLRKKAKDAGADLTK